MEAESLLIKKPEVSIILPVYHVEKYLRRALDSLLGQTFSDFELIVVNDGGTEDALLRLVDGRGGLERGAESGAGA